MNDTKILVRPAPGRVVPDPETGADLPEAGRVVVRSSYWKRREMVGDVLVADVPEVEATGITTATVAPEPLSRKTKGGE